MRSTALVPVAVAAAVALVVAGRSPVPRPVLERGARTVDVTALDAAGCREVDPGDMVLRDHVDPALAPPAGELYPVPIPAAGPHFRVLSPIVDQLPVTPLDVRAVLHNLEHGAIAVWVDAEALDTATLEFVGAWRAQLGAAGFDNEGTGASVFVSPIPEVVAIDATVALRAWGVAVDCDTWSLAAADAFVALHYGTRGAAPESGLGPYPLGNGVLVGPPGADDGGTTTV